MAKGKSFGDIVKSVLSEQTIEEKVEVGGGATGTAHGVDPDGGQAPARKGDKRNSESASKGQNPAGTPIEDTSTENNAKPTSDASGANKATIKAKPSAASSVKEHIDAIFNNEDLSEDFRTKASTIFEAAVQAQLQEEKTKLEEEFATLLVQAKEELQADLVEKLDQYTTYAAEQWMEENRVAIESALKSEITEDFINGLKGLFTEHYIEIPEDKVDVLGQMAEKVQELEDKLNSAINENMELKGQVDESVRERILADVSEGLAATQVEKLAALAEGVDFDNSDNFKKKLELVKDNYFPSTNSSKQLNEEAEDEALALNEETTASPKTGDRAVNAYVSALSRTLKK
jgi:hypothetical protein